MLESLKNNKRTTYFILLLGFIAGIFLIFFTQNSYGGADSIQHYSLARWGWKYPHLLFNNWGKPLFTILISPFAQFGFIGVQIYNLFLGLSTALLIWKIAHVLNFKNAELSALLVIVTPVYFVLMFTSLTEVTFSFFLVLTILLFLKKKYYYSAIIFSFLPLIRTESIVLIPLFTTAFILKKRFLPIVFFSTGFWIISLIGYQTYDDYWWLINKMPYSGSAKDIYGSGTIYHFISNSSDHRAILGKLLGLLFIVGTIISIINWVQKDRFSLSNSFYFLLLVPGSFLVFFAAHSFVWWQGIGNSLGLLRVIGSVTPLAALTALLSINLAIDFINKQIRVSGVIFGYLLLIAIFIFGINDYFSSFKVSEPQKVIDKAASYIKENNLLDQKIYYFNPYTAYKLGIDPYNKTKSYRGVANIEKPSLGIPDSSIIIWDAHFGPNEGRVSLEALQSQKSLHTIKIFKPEIPFKVLGGHNYEVHIFMKDIDLLDELITSFSFDFEKDRNCSTNNSHSGVKSQHLSSNMNYSQGINSYFQDMFHTLSDYNVTINGYIFLNETLKKELPLVCTVQNEIKTTYYKTYDLRNQLIKVGEWNYFEYSFVINNVTSLNELLKVYIWNKHKQDFYLDDLNFIVEKELIRNFTFDFETNNNSSSTDSSYFQSGAKSKHMYCNTDYSEGVDVCLENVLVTASGFSIKTSGYIYIKKRMSIELPLVCVLNDGNENYNYQTYNLQSETTKVNEWNYFEHTFHVENIKSLNDQLKVYIWNMNKQDFFLDDFEINIDPSKPKLKTLNSKL